MADRTTLEEDVDAIMNACFQENHNLNLFEEIFGGEGVEWEEDQLEEMIKAVVERFEKELRELVEAVTENE
jgi:hypothetical protein